MESGRLILVFCGAIFIGVGIPAALFFLMKKENMGNMVGAFKRGSQTARQPWKKDNENLEELSRRVEALRKMDAGTPRALDGEKEDE
jgi:hypothetical protein